MVFSGTLWLPEEKTVTILRRIERGVKTLYQRGVNVILHLFEGLDLELFAPNSQKHVNNRPYIHRIPHTWWANKRNDDVEAQSRFTYSKKIIRKSIIPLKNTVQVTTYVMILEWLLTGTVRVCRVGQVVLFLLLVSSITRRIKSRWDLSWIISR